MNEIRETVYEHLRGEDRFIVTAGEQWSVNMIRRLKEKYPDEVEIEVKNQDGSLLASVPSSWMRIRPKRKIEMSEEKRAELRERFEKVRAS